MAGATTSDSEQQQEAAAPAPPPPPTTAVRAHSPAALLCTTAAARSGGAAGGGVKRQSASGPLPPPQTQPGLLPSAILQRQYLGQPLPHARSSFFLPPNPERALPHDHLLLTYASHTAAGRLDYNYCSPGADPILAVASTTGAFGLSVWRHPLAPGGRPVKLLNLANLHTAPPSSLRWSPLPQQRHEVITIAEDGTCKVTDVAQRAIVATLATPAAPFAAAPVDASTLAVGYGRRVGLWDRRAGPSLVNQQGQPQAGGLVTDVAAVVGAPLLFSASVDGTVKAWDLRRGLDGCDSVATLRFRPADVVRTFMCRSCI